MLRYPSAFSVLDSQITMLGCWHAAKYATVSSSEEHVVRYQMPFSSPGRQRRCPYQIPSTVTSGVLSNEGLKMQNNYFKSQKEARIVLFQMVKNWISLSSTLPTRDSQ